MFVGLVGVPETRETHRAGKVDIIIIIVLPKGLLHRRLHCLLGNRSSGHNFPDQIFPLSRIDLYDSFRAGSSSFSLHGELSLLLSDQLLPVLCPSASFVRDLLLHHTNLVVRLLLLRSDPTAAGNDDVQLVQGRLEEVNISEL